MKTSLLLKTGVIGMGISALCCFTPVLVILFGAVGLAGWVGQLDAVLIPALVVFTLLTIYAFMRQDREAKHATDEV
ncbi:MAG: mercury resistance system transport protein MerF [Mariprofundus sp.]|nr:mercury resistance system transport protein MerF [Mariprofundus sp.]